MAWATSTTSAKVFCFFASFFFGDEDLVTMAAAKERRGRLACALLWASKKSIHVRPFFFSEIVVVRMQIPIFTCKQESIRTGVCECMSTTWVAFAPSNRPIVLAAVSQFLNL